MQGSRMSWSKTDDDPQTLGDAHWSVQPRWLRLYTICIAVPAWVFLLVRILAGDFDFYDITVRTAAFLLATAAVLQIIFIFRGYWRMDI